MIIVRKNDKEELSKYLKDLPEILQGDDVNNLLLRISDIMDVDGMNDNYEMNSLGDKLQCIYDRVYYDNCVEEK